MAAPPLTGITVISLEHAIAAPLCTRQLAELGARVIKIERRGSGDFARYYDTRVKGQSSHFIWTNRSKQSLTLDLKHSDAELILQRLLAQADVLVQNLAPGSAAKMGLDFVTLHAKFDQLIICNISGYGESGPYQQKKAYDLLVQAEAGFLSTTGTPEDMAKSGISTADIAAGMQAHAAILAALIQRSRTNKGSEITISMLEAMVEWMGYPLYYSYDGAAPPPRSGTDHASIFPYGAFISSDEKILMLGIQNEREWQSFCTQVLQKEELAADVRFADNAARSSNRAELRLIIEAIFATVSETQLTQLLDTAQIAYARVNDMHAVWDHPQLKALDRFVNVQTPAGVVSGLKPPGNNSSFAPALGPVPAIGEHTRAILSELGFEEKTIDGFFRDGVV